MPAAARMTAGLSNATLHEGSNISLECTTYASPAPSVWWEQNDVLLPTHTFETVKSFDGNSSLPAHYTSTLTISGANYSSRGMYRCVSSVNQTGSMAESSAFITVYSKSLGNGD